MEFKEGKRFERKEDLLGKDGYIEMEKKLYRMMREEIKDCMKVPIKQGGNMDLKIAKKIHNKANYDC